MIIVKISGGLGNQMFQYALICALQKRYPCTEIKADTALYKLYDAHYGLELNTVFRLEDRGYLQIANPWEQYRVRGEIPLMVGGKIGEFIEVPTAWLNARSRKWFEKRERRNLIHEENEYAACGEREEGVSRVQYLLDTIDCKKNWYVDGYWQNEIYFQSVFPELLERFRFPDLEGKNRELAQKIAGKNSVSIHVRRGDYVSSSYDILNTEYYQKAVRYVGERVECPEYYIFSEDVEYVEKNFRWLPNKVIVDHNREKNSFRDLQLMSMCHHNITANSSFSVWGGFLNRHHDKIVIYPSRYKANEENTEKIEKGWAKINV